MYACACVPVHTCTRTCARIMHGRSDARTLGRRYEVPPSTITAKQDELTTVSIGETMWEASLLLNTQELGTVHTILGLIALLLNIFVQSAFTFIVLNMGADDRVTGDTVDAFHSWRLNIAHRLEYMDRITDQSLAARVCSGDAGIELSQGEACMLPASEA